MLGDNDEILRLIDEALPSYVPKEGPLGLEVRAVNRIWQNGNTRRKRTLTYFIAAFATVCLASGALLIIQRPHTVKTPAQRPVAKAGSTSTAPAAVARVAPFSKPRLLIARKHHGRSRRQVAKLDQFPAPEPLTDEERALLAFRPRKGVSTSVSGNGDIDPIHIEPLKIQPL